MSTMNIEILNPKARKLIQDLADLNLIAIKDSKQDLFMATIKKLRAKKANISLEEITKEVEIVRSKRYAKKA
ncbi:MAG TPA: hypothetical protein DIW47_09185 [Bacteroidetes bacterium]|nr:hypothetical protein [Bacteroidota bacterium]